MSWLRLPGFEHGDPEHVLDDDGRLSEVVVRCRPALENYGWCCLAPDRVRNGKVEVRYRDRRIDPAPTWLVVTVQKVRCRGCKTTLQQEVPHVLGKGHMMTKRFRDDLAMAAIKRPFADAAAINGAEETLVRRIFNSYAEEQLADYRYAAPRVLGVDENHLLHEMRFIAADVEKGHILDMLPDRKRVTIEEGFERMQDWDNVEVWCQDMSQTYRAIARDNFPQALVVVDKFHLVRYANEMLDSVRKAVAARATKTDSTRLRNSAKLLHVRYDTAKRGTQDRISEILDVSPQLHEAYMLKEAFFNVYDQRDRATAEATYRDWVQLASASQKPYWKRLMGIVQRWRSEIFNYFDAPYTSGMVENLNGRVGRIQSAGYGYSFETLRAKSLLRYGNLVPQEELRMYMMSFDTPDDAGWYNFGSGFDPSTLAADLEAGVF